MLVTIGTLAARAASKSTLTVVPPRIEMPLRLGLALMTAAGVNWVVGQTYSESPARWLEAVQLCVELGLDVNELNDMGLAAVHGAANRGSDDIIELLARRGARMDVADKHGRTPYVWAEGVFLATNSPVAKPTTMAVIKRLLSER